MEFHYYDYRWREEKDIYFPEVEAVFQKHLGKNRLYIGKKISFKCITENKSCAGYMNEKGEWNPCVKKEINKSKCEYCRSIEGGFVYTVFDGFNIENLKPGDLEKIQGDHVVYLAAFDELTIKVGVSKISRKILRQLEQGSLATFYIAHTPDGVMARQIETLFRRTGVIDKITGNQKSDMLFPQIEKEVLKKSLLHVLELKKECLNEVSNLKNYILKNPEFRTWEDYYFDTKVSINTKNIHPIKLKKDDIMSGVIVAMKGSFLVLQVENDLYSLDMKKFRGAWIDFSDKKEMITVASTFQDRLF